MNQNSQIKPENAKITMRIIHGVLCVSQIILVAVAQVILVKEFQVATELLLTYVLLSLGFINFGLSRFFYNQAYAAKTIIEFQTKKILSWALAESITIFGVISIILGASENYRYLLFGLGIGTTLFHRPDFEKAKNIFK